MILVRPEGIGHDRTPASSWKARGINSQASPSIQDATGRARDRVLALGIAIGSGYLFETTFKKEVVSDLTGERGVLMGAIYGLWLAQYEVLRASTVIRPSESLQRNSRRSHAKPLSADRRKGDGLDVRQLFSTTAQRGALDWFPKFRDASKPVFEALYKSVATGEETRRTLEANSRPDYRVQLEKELKAIAESEMWRAGAVVRGLRPERASE